MAIVQPRDEESLLPSQIPYTPFPTTPLAEDSNLLAFITDFFDWLETAWQLSLFAPETPRNPLPHPLDLTDSLYTVEDLVRLYGYSASRTYNLLDAYGIVPHSYVHSGGRAGRHALFTKQNLAPVIDQWEWERLLSAIDDWWQRFFPPTCGTCQRCRTNTPYSAATQQFFCSQSIWRNTLRSVFTHFIRDLRQLRSVSAWWQKHRTDTWRGRRCSAWGILFIYFLDRRLLHLSLDELLHLDPLCNSVSRDHRAGVSVAQNMRLHGHQTLPMHLRYLHLLLEDTTNEVRQIFAEKRLRDVRQILGTTAGKIVEGGIAYTVSLEHYLGITLQRALKRRTYGIWGDFWAGALAQRGMASPLTAEDEIVIPEDTYEHAVAQYWYEALGLAVSEVAFECVTSGKWHAEVPSFLDRHKIEALVQFHLGHDRTRSKARWASA